MEPETEQKRNPMKTQAEPRARQQQTQAPGPEQRPVQRAVLAARHGAAFEDGPWASAANRRT